MEKAVCKECNKEFLYYRSTLRGADGKFCSLYCYYAYKKVNGTYNKGKRPMKKCSGCEKMVRMWQTYCSSKCYYTHVDVSKHLPKDNSGKNNPSWKGGITPNTIKERRRFVKEIGVFILKRDNYTCQLCKKRGGELQVDHIQPWSEYVELRFDINNCRTLCRSCHYKITFNREMPKDSKWGKYHLNNFERMVV